MLTRIPAVFLASVLLAGSYASAATAESPGGGTVVCDPVTKICVVVAESPGGGTVPVGAGQCMWEGQVVSCTDPHKGSYDGNGCYLKLMDPQPPAGDPWWSGHSPGDGAIYSQTCINRWIGVPVWRKTPPPGISPLQLAARAVSLLRLRGPAVGIVPKPGSQGGLVGLPVWMWTTVAPNTWGPITRTASVPGVSVTATARAQKIVWAMGDGSQVVCTHPGSPYKQSYGNRQSPDCGYVYGAPADYTVTGTTYWEVTWAGAGQSGRIPLQLSSSTQITIGELQVLIQ